MSYQFRPSLHLTFIFIIITVGLVGLGSWQLQQATYKHGLQTMIDKRTNLTPLSLNMPFDEFAPYQIVKASGHYLTKDSILLDNITYQGQQGYYLVTPFEILASRMIILVNRGWLPKTQAPTLPTFKTPKNIITIEGHLDYPLARSDLNKDISNPVSATPPLWYYIDQNLFTQLHGYPILPLILNLNANGQTSTFTSTPVPRDETELALVQDWPGYDSEYSKNTFYTALWFVLAIIGLGIYAKLGFKKTN